MKNPSDKILVCLVLVLFSSSVGAIEMMGRTLEDFSTENVSSGSSGGGSTYSVDASKVDCLMNSESGRTSSQTVSDVANGISRALNAMKFPTEDFDNASLIHFLAQGKAESTNGSHNMQLSGGNGVGFIQVTDAENQAKANACAQQHDPAIGSNAIEKAKGSGADAQYASALVSLCWWENNMIHNPAHLQYAVSTSPAADEKVSTIVNVGHIAPISYMTDGSQNAIDRETTFTQIERGTGQCGVGI